MTLSEAIGSNPRDEYHRRDSAPERVEAVGELAWTGKGPYKSSDCDR